MAGMEIWNSADQRILTVVSHSKQTLFESRKDSSVKKQRCACQAHTFQDLTLTEETKCAQCHAICVNIDIYIPVCVCVLSHEAVSDSFEPHGLQPSRLLHAWNFPGKNTGAGCHFLLQGNFLIQGSNLHLLCRQAGSLLLSHQGSPLMHAHICNISVHISICVYTHTHVTMFLYIFLLNIYYIFINVIYIFNKCLHTYI